MRVPQASPPLRDLGYHYHPCHPETVETFARERLPTKDPCISKIRSKFREMGNRRVFPDICQPQTLTFHTCGSSPPAAI